MKLPELNQHLNFDEKLFQIFNLFMKKLEVMIFDVGFVNEFPALERTLSFLHWNEHCFD